MRLLLLLTLASVALVLVLLLYLTRLVAQLAELVRFLLTGVPMNDAPDNASGASGVTGWIADRWDSIPVKGPMSAAVTALGVTLALVGGGLRSGPCDTDPLSHVYRPARLKVVEKCVRVTGTVVAYRKEHDGDYHVSAKIDPRYPGDEWVNALNRTRQHGYTVVEFTPFDHKPKFKAGQRLELLGTKVLDLQHGNHKDTGWIELHRIFEFRDVTESPEPQKPNRPALAPPTEEKP